MLLTASTALSIDNSSLDCRNSRTRKRFSLGRLLCATWWLGTNRGDASTNRAASQRAELCQRSRLAANSPVFRAVAQCAKQVGALGASSIWCRSLGHCCWVLGGGRGCLNRFCRLHGSGYCKDIFTLLPRHFSLAISILLCSSRYTLCSSTRGGGRWLPSIAKQFVELACRSWHSANRRTCNASCNLELVALCSATLWPMALCRV